MNNAIKKGGAALIVITGAIALMPILSPVFSAGKIYEKTNNRLDAVEREVETIQQGIGDIMVVLCDPTSSKERGKLADEVCIKRLKGRR